MAETSIVAFGLTVGVLIGLGFVCFALRRIEYVKKRTTMIMTKLQLITYMFIMI